MPLDPRAYLVDIIESWDAIASAVSGLGLREYEANRLVRSSVEREFVIIGEAVQALSRFDPDVFDSITTARRIVDFRSQLTHEYPTVDDALVWAIIQREVPLLRQESERLMSTTREAGQED